MTNRRCVACVLSVLAARCALAAKVKVHIYVEAGCPYCNKYLSGPLQHALDDKDIAPFMEVDISPFGNAYFLTEHCASANTSSNAASDFEYDVGRRDCFNSQCGLDAAGHPEECVAGRLVCQHGPRECSFNRYMACAKEAAPSVSSSPPSHFLFVTCMEEHYWNSTDDSPSDAVLSACSARSGVPRASLGECYRGAGGDVAISKEAAATPSHGGVPWVTVDGEPADEGYEVDALVRAVHKARELPRRRHQSSSGASFLAAGDGAPADWRGKGRAC